MWNLKGTKQMNEEKKKKTDLETETKGIVATVEGVEGWVKKVEDNIVNNIVISLYGDR